jgi:DNA polymerase-1
MKKMLLIDGNAILHRAYHAYPPLTNPKGDIVNAVYGFFSMLLTILQDQKPEYLVVCFDRGKPTVRQTMFAGYHAHRPQISDEFISQIKLVDAIVEKMNIAVFALEGYEGDDLIGTIAAKAGSPEVEVLIVTGDRDMLQLVTPHVKVLMPLSGLTKTALFDEAAVEAKYGVHPRQFIDYKALIGDASDGYPGVSGIGPKSAAKLLQDYGTFENLYEKVNELPEKTGLKLATDAEQASLAKQLATIMTDVPIQFDLKKSLCTDFDLKSLRAAFREQGFNSLLARLDVMYGKEVEPIKEELKKEKESDQLELL